ncbi:transcriptional regulator family: Fungal Specific TF [Penicillium sp. CMV-2018d]|nr:transcriptional regulator family: Fungal Specific TF [Penicillium sp. CMV-2018d]
MPGIEPTGPSGTVSKEAAHYVVESEDMFDSYPPSYNTISSCQMPIKTTNVYVSLHRLKMVITQKFEEFNNHV